MAWPRPFDIYILGGHPPRWGRYVYHRLVWRKPSGDALEVVWRDEQRLQRGDGWTDQYLPWAPITRVLFIYEMIGGLIFMILALAFVLGQIAERWPAWGRKVAVAHLGVAVVAFMYFYPLWAAVPLGAPAWSQGPQSPPWGAKRWFTNCNDHPELHPAIFCWY